MQADSSSLKIPAWKKKEVITTGKGSIHSVTHRHTQTCTHTLTYTPLHALSFCIDVVLFLPAANKVLNLMVHAHMLLIAFLKIDLCSKLLPVQDHLKS